MRCFIAIQIFVRTSTQRLWVHAPPPVRAGGPSRAPTSPESPTPDSGCWCRAARPRRLRSPRVGGCLAAGNAPPPVASACLLDRSPTRPSRRSPARSPSDLGPARLPARPVAGPPAAPIAHGPARPHRHLALAHPPVPAPIRPHPGPFATRPFRRRPIRHHCMSEKEALGAASVPSRRCGT